MFGRVDGLGLRSSCLCFWDPLALYVCPSWIHGQRTKEAILLNDDDTIIINTVTPRRQDTTKQPAVGAVKSDDDRWETRTCIAANNSLEVIWSFSPPERCQQVAGWVMVFKPTIMHSLFLFCRQISDCVASRSLSKLYGALGSRCGLTESGMN